MLIIDKSARIMQTKRQDRSERGPQLTAGQMAIKQQEKDRRPMPDLMADFRAYKTQMKEEGTNPYAVTALPRNSQQPQHRMFGANKSALMQSSVRSQSQMHTISFNDQALPYIPSAHKSGTSTQSRDDFAPGQYTGAYQPNRSVVSMHQSQTSLKKKMKKQKPMKRGSVSRYDMTQQRIMSNIEHYNQPSLDTRFTDSLYVVNNQPQMSMQHVSKDGSQFFENQALNGGLSTEDSIFQPGPNDNFQTNSIVIYETTGGDETAAQSVQKGDSRRDHTVYGALDGALRSGKNSREDQRHSERKQHSTGGDSELSSKRGENTLVPQIYKITDETYGASESHQTIPRKSIKPNGKSTSSVNHKSSKHLSRGLKTPEKQYTLNQVALASADSRQGASEHRRIVTGQTSLLVTDRNNRTAEKTTDSRRSRHLSHNTKEGALKMPAIKQSRSRFEIESKGGLATLQRAENSAVNLDRNLPSANTGSIEGKDQMPSMRIASLPLMSGIQPSSTSQHHSSSKATMIPINNMYPSSAVRLISHAELEGESDPLPQFQMHGAMPHSTFSIPKKINKVTPKELMKQKQQPLKKSEVYKSTEVGPGRQIRGISQDRGSAPPNGIYIPKVELDKDRQENSRQPYGDFGGRMPSTQKSNLSGDLNTIVR